MVNTPSDRMPEPELPLQFVCFSFVLNTEQNLDFVTLPSVLVLIVVIVFQSSGTA